MLFSVPQAPLLISPLESGTLSSKPEEKLKQPSILQQNTDSNLCNWLFIWQTLFQQQPASSVRAEEERCYNPPGIKTSAEESMKIVTLYGNLYCNLEHL